MVSSNEKKKMNRVLLEGKLLDLARQDLDKQLERRQSQMKRETAMLMDQYMDHKATNYSTLYKKKEFDEPFKIIQDQNASSTKLPDNSELHKLIIKEESHYNIYEKFVEQKRKYYPNYLKQPNKFRTSLPEFDDNISGMLGDFFLLKLEILN